MGKFISLREQIEYVSKSKEGMMRIALPTHDHLHQLELMEAIERSLIILQEHVRLAVNDINRNSSKVVRKEHED